MATLYLQARGAGLGLKPPPPGADLTQSRGPMIQYTCGVMYGVASLVILARFVLLIFPPCLRQR
jgi:hypothetical protein